MNDTDTLKSIDAKLSALIALGSLLLTTDEGEKQTKLEVVLRKAGLEIPSIAQVLRKSPDAVSKAIQRASK